jgi:hypothetical protein
MVDRPPWPSVVLTRSWPSGSSGPRRLATRWGKEGGRHGESVLASTEAWKAVRRQSTDNETSAQKGDNMGMVRAKRRVGGVGIFTGGGATFYRAEARQGRLGAFNGRR